MITVLIAEDEKFIRLGLKAMIGRAGLPVTDILEARDGQEALDILKSRPVDLLVTDIRMPKMDGIELVERLQALPRPPLVLVISGYDDFNYAVAMLRSGVQDYLLKPVERAKLQEALARLEAVYQERCRTERDGERQFAQSLRLIVLETDEESESCREAVLKNEAAFMKGPYVVCYASEAVPDVPEEALVIPAAQHRQAYVVPAGACLEAEKAFPIGCSQPREGLAALHSGYLAAVEAWKRAFFAGAPRWEQAICPSGELTLTAERLLGHVSLSQADEVCRLLRGAAEQAARDDIAPDAFAQVCAEFIKGLCDTYHTMMDGENDPVRFVSLWHFENAQDYLTQLENWITAFCERLTQEFSDFENKQKIRQAVSYLHEHFRESINMAMVSNHVSMNYTIFSVLFKQYTGVNFVSYLQDMRLKEAMRLLETTDWRVNEIGRRSGFVDEKHFLKVFKALSGFSPTEYRRAKRLTGMQES